MAQLKFGSAGVSATEIDLSGPVAQQPVGVPAGVIGTSVKGQAFVPITVAVVNDFYQKFGPTDGLKFGPLAVTEWLRNAQALTYLKVLGVGDGKARQGTPANQSVGNNPQTGIAQQIGDVNEAGFTVGENEPSAAAEGNLNPNPYANLGGPQGRTYFLGAFMSESNGSTVFSSAGTQPTTASVPIIRGVIMAASGVVLTLSSTAQASVAPSAAAVGSDGNGGSIGATILLQNGLAKSDFVLLLNGLQGTTQFPNVITCSFDITSPNYFANVLNTDPYNLMQAGHYVYANWDIHPVTAVVTGAGVVPVQLGAGAATTTATGIEQTAFLLTGSLARDTASSYVPDYEDFRDRFSAPESPWVVSQPFGGKPQNLFKVCALDDGAGVSTLYKLSIENLAPSTDPADQYGTFDLVVRAWDDNDSNPTYLEQWRGLSLDPSDAQYIAQIIGDQNAYFDFDRGPTAQKLVVDGNYANASNYIRVQMASAVDNGQVDPTALPVGVRGIAHLVTAGSSPLAVPVLYTSASFNTGHFTGSVPYGWGNVVQPPLPMRQNITQGSGAKSQVNALLYWGTQFEHVTSLATPNLSTLPNLSLNAVATYFPNFSSENGGNMDFLAGDQYLGAQTTTRNGTIDPDLFNLDGFNLMNIQVVTNSAGTADPNQWVSAQYMRYGVTASIIPNDANKTRGLQIGDFIQSNRRFLKWSFLVQGGFDGVNIFDEDEATLDNAAVAADMDASNRNFNLGPNVVAYTTALNIMGEVTNTDLQLLAIPGIRNPVVTDAAIAAVENRFDAMFIMDIDQYDNNDELITDVDTALPSVTYTAQNFAERALDSSFAASYFPDVVMPDPTTKTNVIAPPSVVVLGALALNDAVGYPWFAPAGFTRGALQTALEARVKLSKPNMDVLYDVNINPLVAFPGNAQGGTNPKGGVVVWGQKTLQQAASALDRVNVRRLLIEIRRQVRDIAMSIVFEPNRDATLALFSAAVTPKLQRIQALAGLQRFKVVIDSSTTSQQDIENNTIRGKIYVQPTKSIEFVSLDFVVTNNLNQQQ